MAQDPKTNPSGEKHPGMLGDGTEEQNLNQKGNPGARITEAEVDDAFLAKSGKAKPGGKR